MTTQGENGGAATDRKTENGRLTRKWLIRLAGAGLILSVGMGANIIPGIAQATYGADGANGGEAAKLRTKPKKPHRMPPRNPYPDTPAAPTVPDPDDEEPAPIDSLKKIPVPGPNAAELEPYIADRAAALRLGKALFWDVRVGSHNHTACASCHFSAGADPRVKNQLSPGLIAGDKTFQLGGPNYTLTPEDFPFTRFVNINNAATRYADINDVAGSQGVLAAMFGDTSSDGERDTCKLVSDSVGNGGLGFHLDRYNTRRVEPRNTPTMINAAFNFRNFWDGRGNNMFNAGDPFGLRNPLPQVWKLEYGVLRHVNVALPTSALASLSVGPPGDVKEMSCTNRSFAFIGKKLLAVPILADQTISASDSVLGALADNRPKYGALVRQAFRPEFWSAKTPVQVPVALPQTSPVAVPPAGVGTEMRQFAQIEANFSLFFGLAVQMYMRTQISDDTPFDRFKEGQTNALTAQQKRGMDIFTGPVANCIRCHSGPTLTAASFDNVMAQGRLDMRAGLNDSVFRYDTGFFNTGMRPTRDDPGIGGLDPLGNPLSETRMTQLGKTALLGNRFNQTFKENLVEPGALTAVDGAFKTPGLRNVEFTGPYFHNGGKSTLMQVVDAYNRGGDFGAENQPFTDPAIRPLGLTQREKEDLVAFLLSLSDERVRYQRAPFDHPSICVPIGLGGDHKNLLLSPNGFAYERRHCIREVGARGSGTPIGTFLDLNPYQH